MCLTCVGLRAEMNRLDRGPRDQVEIRQREVKLTGDDGPGICWLGIGRRKDDEA